MALWTQLKRMAFVLCAAVVAGCGAEGDFPTVATTGTVLCEGKPVPYALVFFEPLQGGKSALVGKQGIGNADEQGRFAISTYGEDDGAVIGRHRVRVGPPRGGGPPGFKCNCVLNSEVDVTEVDVKKGERNDFELVLKKRTGREQLLPER